MEDEMGQMNVIAHSEQDLQGFIKIAKHRIVLDKLRSKALLEIAFVFENGKPTLRIGPAERDSSKFAVSYQSLEVDSWFQELGIQPPARLTPPPFRR